MKKQDDSHSAWDSTGLLPELPDSASPHAPCSRGQSTAKAQRTWGFSHQQWGYFIGFTLKNGDLTMWLAAAGNLFRDIKELKLRLVKFNPILRELPNHSHYSVTMRDGH